MSSGIEIITAGPEHEADIIPLMIAFNKTELITWRPATMIPGLRELLRSPHRGIVQLARDGDRVLGYGIATFGYDIEFSGEDAFITELFVDGHARRRGTGRLLLQSLVLALRKRGTKAVHLMVRPENELARALYQKLAFRVIPRLLMTKELAEPSE